MTLKARFSLIPLCCLVLVIGCTSATGNKVQGKVSYKGAPVTGGTMTFHLADGSTRAAIINPDGTYSASDIAAGEVIVTVETESLKRAESEYKNGKNKQVASPVPTGGAPVSTGTYVKIPAKYKDKDKSDAKLTIASGNNVNKDVTLTD